MSKTVLVGLVAALALCAAPAHADRTAQEVRAVQSYAFTAFPLYGAVVTPSDTVNLSEPGQIRADADGAVTAICYGNTAEITLNMVAGEYFPCVVKRVLDTGTDSIVIHVFY